MRFGQVELLLHAITQADAEPLPAAEGDQRLGQLVAGAVLIGPGVGESDQALQTVFLGLHQHHRGDHQQTEADHANTTEEQHRHCGAHHDHGRTEIGLQQQQERHGQQDQEGFGKAPHAFANFLLPAHQIAGQVDHHEDFRQLGRLHVEGAETDPAHRTVHFPADSRQQDQDQQAERRQQQHPVQALPDRQRYQQHRNSRAEAQRHINQMATHVIQRIAGIDRRDFG